MQCVVDRLISNGRIFRMVLRQHLDVPCQHLDVRPCLHSAPVRASGVRPISRETDLVGTVHPSVHPACGLGPVRPTLSARCTRPCIRRAAHIP